MTQPDANVLGALALVLTDRMTEAAAAAAGQSETTATALSALHHFLDQASIDRLRQVLGLTSSGTVRLVDRLAAAGYVTREPGTDGRSVAVALTAEGRRAAERVTATRAEVLEGALARLSPADREHLERIMGTLLTGFIRGPGATRWICRLCDTTACRTGDRCPIGRVTRPAPNPR